MFKTSIVRLNAVYLLSLKREFHLCFFVFFLPNHTGVVYNNDSHFMLQRSHSKTNCNPDRVDYTARGILFLSTNLKKKTMKKKKERSSLLAYYSYYSYHSYIILVYITQVNSTFRAR